MVGCSMDSMGSMDSESMVGMVGRMDKLGKMGIENVGDVFCDVFHSRRIHSHHHRICRTDRNQIVSIFFPPFDFILCYATED
jgi:hypothetical protein